MSDKDWALVCAEEGCDAEWSDTVHLDAVELHFDMEHDGRQIAFNLDWRGKGPKPEPTEPNRRQRRAERKKGR